MTHSGSERLTSSHRFDRNYPLKRSLSAMLAVALLATASASMACISQSEAKTVDNPSIPGSPRVPSGTLTTESPTPQAIIIVPTINRTALAEAKLKETTTPTKADSLNAISTAKALTATPTRTPDRSATQLAVNQQKALATLRAIPSPASGISR